MFDWFRPKLTPEEEMTRERRRYKERVLKNIRRLDGYGRQIVALQALEEMGRFLEKYKFPAAFRRLPVEGRNQFLADLVATMRVYKARGEHRSALGVEAFGVWVDFICFDEPDEADRFLKSL